MTGGIVKVPVDTPTITFPGGIDATQIPSNWLGERSHPGQKSIDAPPPPPPPPPPPQLLAAALVVTVYVPATQPTVSVALLAVEFAGDDTSLTAIVSPELVVPVRVVNEALLILYSPPTTETTACALIPDMMTGLDVY